LDLALVDKSIACFYCKVQLGIQIKPSAFVSCCKLYWFNRKQNLHNAIW